VRELVRAQGELVELVARNLVLLGDQLGAETLADDVVLGHQLGREREPVLLLDLHRRGKRQLAHVLDPAADDDVVDAAGDLRGGEVDGLLGGTALKIDRCRGGLDRETLLQPGIAANVQTLGPELSDAARDHILDLSGIDVRALDDRAVGRAEKLVGMGFLVVALLDVAAPDRRPGGFNNDDLATIAIAIRGHRRLLLCLSKKRVDERQSSSE
jgi:hypothetical protein